MATQAEAKAEEQEAAGYTSGGRSIWVIDALGRSLNFGKRLYFGHAPSAQCCTNALVRIFAAGKGRVYRRVLEGVV